MVKTPKISQGYNTPISKLKKQTINQAYRSTINDKSVRTDMVDLAKFNAETNEMSFFKKLVKSVRIFIQSNFRGE